MIAMSYAERLEKGLIACARHYAPRLVPPDWTQPGEYRRPLPELAHQLAGYGVLIMVGDVPPHLAAQASLHHREWVETYKSLYSLIAGGLFPSFKNVQAFYVDQNGAPPIVGLQGDAIPVIEMLAGYVTPFVAARQGAAAEVELVGLLDMILEELEAGDLPRDGFRALRDNGAAYVRQILNGYTRQIALTPALRAVFGDAAPPPPLQAPPLQAPPRMETTQGAPSFNTQTIAQPPPPIQPPLVLPEEDRIDLAPPPSPLPEEPQFRTGSIPVFFDAGRRDKAQRRPPVPDLPEE